MNKNLITKVLLEKFSDAQKSWLQTTEPTKYNSRTELIKHRMRGLKGKKPKPGNPKFFEAPKPAPKAGNGRKKAPDKKMKEDTSFASRLVDILLERNRANAIRKRAMFNTPEQRNEFKFGKGSDGGGPDGGKSEQQVKQEFDHRIEAHKAARGVKTRGVNKSK